MNRQQENEIKERQSKEFMPDQSQHKSAHKPIGRTKIENAHATGDGSLRRSDESLLTTKEEDENIY